METAGIDRFRSSILKWYGKHRRSLPWRTNPTPYRVWISEIMLQQTQVKSAVPYFNRFVKRFPDIASLAHASEEEILAIWSGLGYYSRARNLHKAARKIVDCHEGIFPTDYKTVLSLPGIGRYTAGAVCSIAFNQAQPVVDGNIRRVIARLKGIKSRIPEKYFWDQMSEWVPEKKASAFNQAMMELGATICLPSQPACRQCPVHRHCLAKRKNLQNSIPLSKPRKAVRKVDLVILAVKHRGRVLLTRQEDGFIPGKWGLPSRIVPSRQTPGETAQSLNNKMFGGRLPIEFLAILKHSITHHRISAHIYTGNATGKASEILEEKDRIHWANDLQLDAMLTSSLFRKAIQKCR
ncbi:MAG: A/G-specific adenine glycosylase [Acidobacteria bacterium]|nr:A/G-specific adenine glycosylase [Acidobacteriota bacterium]